MTRHLAYFAPVAIGIWAGSVLAGESQTVQVAAAEAASFEALDKNADGKVSLNEASVNDPLFVAFKNLDKDRDGLLTKEEFAAFRGEKSGA